jgi:deoxyadenosine/deoxycytidine kinase
MKRIVSLVGMVGAGKTTTINALRTLGYDTLKEDYIEISNALSCDNRLILSKWAWVSNWFYKVEKYFHNNPSSTLLFVDRNAIEAGLWTDSCKPLFEPIKLSLEEFSSRGYEILKIYLKCDYAILENRLKSRLLTEPERLKFNENNPQFIQSLYQSYVESESLWNLVIDSHSKNTEQICSTILEYLRDCK